MGKRIAAKITGVAGYVPPRVLTNADLEKKVETTDAWIRERTGIRERHIVDAGVGTSDLGKEAAVKAVAARDGVVGSFVAQRRVTDLLDVPALVRAGVPGFLDATDGQ